MHSLALALSLFVLSQSALLVRLAEETSALEIGLWRMALAVPVLLLLGAIQGQLVLLRKLRSGQLAALGLCGLSLFGHWFAWFMAVKQTSLANSMVFFAVSPIFTALGAWMFFREPFERRHALAMGLCFAGILIIFRDSLRFDPSHLNGDLLALLASFLFSVYVLLGKGIRRKLGNLPFTILTYSSAGLFFLACLLVRDGSIRADFHARTWLLLALLALGPTLLGHGLFTYCLQFFNVNLMSILVLTEPVLGAMVAYFVISEPLTPGVVMGFLAISSGVLALFLPLLAKGRSRA
jgi:drug/metabolite transporter (DMT)-like permease